MGATNSRDLYLVLYASEVFQAGITEILEGTEEVQNAQDYITVWGERKTKHDSHLRMPFVVFVIVD